MRNFEKYEILEIFRNLKVSEILRFQKKSRVAKKFVCEAKRLTINKN